MTDAVYNDEDWSPPGAKAAPAKPTPVEQAPTKTDASTGNRITIYARRQPRDTDVYDDEDWKPSTDKMAGHYREVSPGEAAAYGAANIGSYGLAPAIAGLSAAGAAGKTPEQQAAFTPPDVNAEGAGFEQIGEGIGRLWNDHFGNTPDPQAREAYTQGRESMLNSQQMASDQHGIYYTLGQLGAALAMPGTIGRAAVAGFFGKIAPGLAQGLAGRLGGAALTGGVMAGAQGAGEAVSEGRPEDIPTEAGKGFATGAALGGAGGAALEGAGAVAGKVGTIVRGQRALTNEDTLNAEAGKQVLDALGSDYKRFGPTMTREQQTAAHEAGTPLALVDVGHERTRELFRRGANLSPEGRQAAEDLTQPRFEQQSPRIAGFVRRITGGANATAEEDRITAAKLAFNPPMYKRAYQAGDRPIWSPELERLSGDPGVQAAISKAIKTGKSWAILDGMGGFNPSIRVTDDGQLIFNKGPTGVPTYPNIQFWDYVQRELRGAINATKDSADRTRMTGIRNLLLKDLDSQVPEFGQARQTAATFFGAEDALEAGQKFVMGNQDIAQAARAISGFKPEERELFARGFASDLAAKIEAVPDNQSVINKAFLNSTAARTKINMALGPDRANELETLLRSEIVIDKARKALGNSTTTRQLAEAGMTGASAAGAAESLKHTTFAGLILGGLGVHRAQKGLAHIDENVARRVTEMLASDDYSKLDQAIKIMSKSPTWMNALRRATGAGVRAGAPDIGFTNLAAGATVGAEDIGDIFKKKEHEPEHHEQEPQYQDNTQ